MYNINKTGFGYKITFSDTITPDEMSKWVSESEKALSTAPSKFSVFVDMRTLKPLAGPAQEHLKKGQGLYKAKGMVRSVVVLESTIIAMQFKRIAKETGICDWERYIATDKNPNWEQSALDWVAKGIDPDLKMAA